MNQGSIKGTFQGFVNSDTVIYKCRVISASPIYVEGVEDAKRKIGPQSLIVPEHLRDHKVMIDFSHTTEDAAIPTETHSHNFLGGNTEEQSYTAAPPPPPADAAHTHNFTGGSTGEYTSPAKPHSHVISGAMTVTVKAGLKEGDIVHVLQCNDEKKFYILGRA